MQKRPPNLRPSVPQTDALPGCAIARLVGVHTGTVRWGKAKNTSKGDGLAVRDAIM